jgi:hypothetical protein
MPTVPMSAGKVNLAEFLQAAKDNIDLITGVRGGAIQPLASTASLTDVINKVNEIITRINF